MSDRLTRRKLVQYGGVTGTLLLAGCLGGDDGGDDTTTEETTTAGDGDTTTADGDTTTAGDDDTTTEDGTTTADDGEPPTVALSVPSLAFTFFARMENAFNAAIDAGEISEDSQFYGAGDSSAEQVSQLETAITNEVDFIMVSAITEGAVGSAIEDAVDAGIPVVAIDRNVESDATATYVASDNVQLGQRSTELLVGFMQDQSDQDSYGIVQIEGTAGASVTNERGEGFQGVVDEDDSLSALGSQTGEFETQTAVSVMEDFITSHGDDIDGVFAQNDLMALGAHQVVQGSDIGPIPITGIDGTQSWVELFGDNEYYGTIAQLPEEMVNTAIEHGKTALQGGDLEDQYVIEGLEVTQENAQEYLDEYL